MHYLAYAAVLALLIGYAYGPSLKHLPRADDWWYYLNTIDTYTFGDTFSASYSYARTRTVMPGDESFYRPLFFALLAFKKDGVGPHFAWHQAMPLVLHGAFCFLVMLLLDRLRIEAQGLPERQGPSAGRLLNWMGIAIVYILPAFIAVNAALFDAVIWTHITGYLLFYVFTLLAVYLLVHDSRPDHHSRRVAGVAAGVLALAIAFLYEYGQFYALVLVPWALTWKRPRRDRFALAAALVTVPILYQGANAIDKHYHAPAVEDTKDMDFYVDSILEAGSPRTVASMYRFARYAGGVPFFSSSVPIGEKEERILVHELSIRRVVSESPAGWFGLGVLPLWVLVAAAGYARAVRRAMYRIPAVGGTLLALSGLYALGISLVRINPDAHLDLVLAGSSYYMYWPFALLLIVLGLGSFLFTSLSSKPMGKRVALAVLTGALGYLLVEGAASVFRLHELNTSLAESQSRSREIVTAVNSFFDDHPGARVAFDLAHSADVPDTWDLGVPLTTLLYRGREDNFNPTHVIRVGNGEVEASEYNQEPRAEGQPLVPHLVIASRNMNVYLYDGVYYGLLRFEGRFAPDRFDTYRYLASGRAVEEVVRRADDLVAQRDRDVAAGLLRDRYWH